MPFHYVQHHVGSWVLLIVPVLVAGSSQCMLDVSLLPETGWGSWMLDNNRSFSPAPEVLSPILAAGLLVGKEHLCQRLSG